MEKKQSVLTQAEITRHYIESLRVGSALTEAGQENLAYFAADLEHEFIRGKYVLIPEDALRMEQAKTAQHIMNQGLQMLVNLLQEAHVNIPGVADYLAQEVGPALAKGLAEKRLESAQANMRKYAGQGNAQAYPSVTYELVEA